MPRMLSTASELIRVGSSLGIKGLTTMATKVVATAKIEIRVARNQIRCATFANNQAPRDVMRIPFKLAR